MGNIRVNGGARMSSRDAVAFSVSSVIVIALIIFWAWQIRGVIDLLEMAYG